MHLKSAAVAVAATRKLLEASEKTYQLLRDLGATGSGGVLETLRAKEVPSFARLAWFELVPDYDKAKAALRRATGG